MKIALCTPITLNMLAEDLGDPLDLPTMCHPYPFAVHLAREYVRAGHFVTVVTQCWGLNETRRWSGHNLEVVAVPRRKRLAVTLDFFRAEVRGMRDVLREASPDVIHAQWTYQYADAALSSGLPVLVTARDAPWTIVRTQLGLDPFQRALHAQLLVIPRIRNLSTLSPYMVGVLRRQCFYRRDITIIPNGIVAEKFVEVPRTSVRKKREPVICCISGWVRHKNLKCGLWAFGKIKSRIPGARLLLFGHGLGNGDLAEQFCARHGLLEGVEFRGYSTQKQIMRALLEEVDIVMHTALEESFGMTIADAMAKGIPCVGGIGAGATPWILDDGRCGQLVDITSPQEIADGVLELVKDPERYRECAEKGLQRARDEFGLERVAQAYIAKLEQVAGESAGANAKNVLTNAKTACSNMTNCIQK
jgi:glycosyltransferase involved in cell wall biosynthesis